MKICSECKQEKPLNEFYGERRRKDGKMSRCKECDAKRARKWREVKAEKRTDYNKSYYQQNRTKQKEKALKRYHEKRDDEITRMRRRYEENREKHIAQVTEWNKANPDKVNAIQQRRRAQKLALPNEPVDYLVVFERDEGICGICGEVVDPKNWHLDHIIPLARGGHHTYENVQVSHPSCNISKGAREKGTKHVN